MNDNVMAGIISGLIVTLFVVVFRNFWRGSIIPWFEDRVYKDLKIEGTWFSLYPTVIGERPETITLKRHGHAVTGFIVCNSGADEGKIYYISGSFRNTILTLFYESADRRNLDRGTITLKSVKNGSRFVGKIASYEDYSDSITSKEIIWFRSKKDKEKTLKEIRNKDAMVQKIQENSEELNKELKELLEDFKSKNNSESTSVEQDI